MTTIGVIGGGAWGTALAQIYAREARDVMLWAREAEVVESINARHENAMYMPGAALSDHLKASGDLKEVAGRDILLLVTPAQYMRDSLQQIAAGIMPQQTLVICSKGIEIESGKLLSDVASEVVPRANVAVLTGPTFAREIAQGKPAAVTIAAQDMERAKALQEALGTESFRPYTSTDVIGAQIAGAVKNVIAIACGVAHGKGMGENARAALVTRGTAEIVRLGAALGARTETLLGLCGMGDLVLTCSSMQSRNFSLGAALGEGKALEEVLGARNAVTEGVHTARSTFDLAQKLGVDMPITMAVKALVVDGAHIDHVVHKLLSRPFGTEISEEA